MKAKSALAEFLNHLTFLGYKIQDEHDGSYIAKHEQYFNMIVEEKATGVMLYSWFKGNKAAHDDRPGFLECINTVNTKAKVLRFYVDQKNDLMMDVWFPRYYNRVGFANFMDLLCRDMQLLFSEEYGVKKYCG